MKRNVRSIFIAVVTVLTLIACNDDSDVNLTDKSSIIESTDSKSSRRPETKPYIEVFKITYKSEITERDIESIRKNFSVDLFTTLLDYSECFKDEEGKKVDIWKVAINPENAPKTSQSTRDSGDTKDPKGHIESNSGVSKVSPIDSDSCK